MNIYTTVLAAYVLIIWSIPLFVNIFFKINKFMKANLINLHVDSSKIVHRNFSGDDDIIRYATNYVKLPRDWIYHTKKITYTLNGQLYRCDPFDKIDWSNSIILFGCSLVFGIGVAEEDTISARLKEYTGVNVVNLGVTGSCQQLSFYNMMLLKNNHIKPKAIIHIWTHDKRPFHVKQDYTITHAGPWNNFGLPQETPSSVMNHLFGSKSPEVSAMFNRMTANLLYQDIPVIHASFFEDMCNEQNSKYPDFPLLHLKKIDNARDLMHTGIESNKLAARLLNEELIKLLVPAEGIEPSQER